MRFTKDKIGAGLIEAITEGLYDGTLNCLREYVQNAIDAHARRIDIEFEGPKTILIRDDGDGMDRKELERALSVGISDKSEKDIGWRGLGIWSGTSACHTLVINTKKVNEDKLRIVVDNEYLRKEIRPKAGMKKPAEDVLTGATSEIETLPLGADESRTNDHFTTIRLESLLPQQIPVFEKKDIREFLMSVVPASFDRHLFPGASEVDDTLKKNGIDPPLTEIFFEKRRILSPPTDVSGFYDEIIWKDFKVDGNLIAIGWFLLSKKNRAPSAPNRGIVFKKKGFTIGDSDLVRKQYAATFHPWHFGEIHIVSESIRENAARNNFEYNSESLAGFLESVKEYLRNLELLNQYASTTTSPSRLQNAQEAVKVGDLQKAKDYSDDVRKKLAQTRSFPPDAAFKHMKKVIDAENLREAAELRKVDLKIAKEKARMTPSIRTAKEQQKLAISSLPPEMQKNMRRFCDGKIGFAAAITDSIVQLLSKKTGDPSCDLNHLAKAAFDWEEVHGRKPSQKPLLSISGQFTGSGSREDNRLIGRNRRFGVTVYTFHDLLVNIDKHAKGEKAFAWYEKASEYDKTTYKTQISLALGFLYRMIDSAEVYTGK
jgi:hypothetical protein